jgi:hypothetical protein
MGQDGDRVRGEAEPGRDLGRAGTLHLGVPQDVPPAGRQLPERPGGVGPLEPVQSGVPERLARVVPSSASEESRASAPASWRAAAEWRS